LQYTIIAIIAKFLSIAVDCNNFEISMLVLLYFQGQSVAILAIAMILWPAIQCILIFDINLNQNGFLSRD